MKKRKPQPPQGIPESEFSPDKTSEQLEDTTFVEIGGSPIPGLTLRHVLRGHTGSICRPAWSPDGAYLASPSSDQSIRIWGADTGACVHILKGHTRTVLSVAWSPEAHYLASASENGDIYLWDTITGKHIKTMNGRGHIPSISWSPNGQFASATPNGAVLLWDTSSGTQVQVLNGHESGVYSVAWSPDGQRLVSGSYDTNIVVWDAGSGDSMGALRGHNGGINNVAWSADGQRLVSTADDKTIRIWDAVTGKALRVLEEHSDKTNWACFSFNDRWLACKGRDNTVRLWRCDTWACVAVLHEPVSGAWWSGIAFHPNLPILATLGTKDTIIRIWELDEALLLSQAQENVHYTTAKLVLVGDSGVGKTGLGWRLAHGEFKEHSSTHGQQFWPLTQLGLKRKDGTECEAVLWDLAGQHAYRQIHSIFLDNVAAALVLFDASNRQQPLKGVQFWLEQLKGKGQLPPTVLIGARADVCPPALTQQEFDQFCQRYGITGGYLSTSAKRGEGLETLLERLKAQISWDEMTATVTTVTFKRIKDYVLALKEKPDREGVLVSPSTLREQLQATDQHWSFTDAEMMTAVGHLETHGYVAVLRSSAGEKYILLTSDLLATLASSIVFLADKNPRDLGAISETELLQGRYQFNELAGLSLNETQILLDAAILRFLEHNICFRETLGDETLLIFPGLIKQKRPLQDDLLSTDDISYVVRGRVENLYASLVVLLGYTPSFTRINQWQNQAQYEMEEGQICGFRLIEDREGELELVLYYDNRMPLHGRAQFQVLFEQFLYQRDVEVTRFPPVVCAKGHQQKRATVIERVREGKPFMFCDECGDKITLPDFEKPQSIGTAASLWLQLEEAGARLRSAYEVHLTKVKGLRRNWATPRCYVSRMEEQSDWAKELVKDLREAGVYVVDKAAQVQAEDFVVVLDTPAYQRAFRSKASVLAEDMPLIKSRLNKSQLISLALTGGAATHEFEDCEPGSFSNESHYPVSLFDLVLNLYVIPLNHPGFAPLRKALHTQWEETLGQKKVDDATSPLKVFISYSHTDEEFKKEFVTMLTGLQDQGVVDVWHDRRIEEGDEWYEAIKKAMNKCDLAILFVSPDFIASRFIKDNELPRLFQRRQEQGLRVVPIIVRPCKWKSQPVLKDLQALPQDGKPVITFSKDNGDRDKVWEDIATAIEKRANEARQ
jgi:small GTP-binding protein